MWKKGYEKTPNILDEWKDYPEISRHIFAPSKGYFTEKSRCVPLKKSYGTRQTTANEIWNDNFHFVCVVLRGQSDEILKSQTWLYLQ